jgi:hypothetical protein
MHGTSWIPSSMLALVLGVVRAGRDDLRPVTAMP